MCYICRIFGPHKNPSHQHGPSRLIVRDAMLTEASKAELEKAQSKHGLHFAEVKSENWINRNTGTAGDPRTQERIPAGTEFDLNLSLRIFEGDPKEQIVDYVKDALRRLEKDTLGGSGTRGYGWVELKDLTDDLAAQE